VRIDRQWKASNPEWLLSTRGRGQPIAVLRELNGAFFVFRADAEPGEPPLVFRSMLDALKAVTPPSRRRLRPIYVAGALRRQRLWSDDGD
jgi:hypothetical protein